MYHRVVDLERDPWNLAVAPDRFAEHLEIIRRYGVPLSLSELVERVHQQRVPQHGVVLTFDDGYLDNLETAKPLLAEYGIPATVFVTTGKLGRPREFWWDELEQIILGPATLPEELVLTGAGRTQRWVLGAATSADTRAVRFSSRRGEKGTRRGFFRSVFEFLQPLPHADRDLLLAALADWARVRTTERETHRTISRAQLIELAHGELIEIGAHTVTHPLLSVHPQDVQLREIHGSKEHLEDALRHPVTTFAFPHGDFDERSVAIARDEFSGSCTAEPGAVWNGSDPHRLPRWEVRNWDGDEFARRLNRWLSRYPSLT
jgi:peptidoglycan/xylan/chitin deacetylase (PgdA/CDA1 family)